VRNSLLIFTFFILTSEDLYSDSFTYNSFNNHGVIGLVNMPSARFYDEAAHGITIYDGAPDQKLTLTASPFDWMEASFFYTNIKECNQDSNFSSSCYQDYKDKGFNFKVRVKEEGIWPAIAIGINDIAGTGFYSSEYIVGSYGIKNTDFHFGLAWGTLNGSNNSFENPLGYLYDGFYDRPTNTEDRGGQFQPSRYFSGKKASLFYGLSHVINERLILKIENDTTNAPGKVGYKESKQKLSYGLDFAINSNFSFGFSFERGNDYSIRLVYKKDSKDSKKTYKYKKAKYDENENKYSKLIKNIENNEIGVNKIIKKGNSIGIELTQFAHPSIEMVEEIISFSALDADIDDDLKINLKSANLSVVENFDDAYGLNIYTKNKKQGLNTNTFLSLRPYIASREEFFKGALLIENNSEYIFNDALFFNVNIKYSLADNFDDLIIPPENTYPAQVRSDVKDYLRSFGDGIFIGRAQFDYHLTPRKNHHLMISAGILEEMFSGVGFEYLYSKQDSNYAFGFEIFDVTKRDYEMRFGTLDYKNVTGSANFYYRNYDIIPFDAKVSYGEYLAGDEGVTFELSRSFLNGTKFGVFASFTDVSSEQFGEGTFDKGIFFNIPVYGDFINYSWRPLTKDPGAKLNRKHTLHDLLIKFKPYNY
jgi:hypothetical protein